MLSRLNLRLATVSGIAQDRDCWYNQALRPHDRARGFRLDPAQST